MESIFDSLHPYKKKQSLAGDLLDFADEFNPGPKNAQFEIIKLNVTDASTLFTSVYKTKTSHNKLFGLAMHLTDPLAIEGSTFSLYIDDREIFAEGTQALVLTFNLGMPPMKRYMRFRPKDINQTEIRFRFTSSDQFTLPYVVTLYLMTE